MKNVKNFIETRYREEIRSHIKLNSREGEFTDFPENLHIRIKNILEKDKIDKLYSHQDEAFSLISENIDTLLVLDTASGKTLSFFLPILNEYIHAETPFTVLMLYPTKALSRDQENTFSKIMKDVLNNKVIGTYDGDTPKDERSRISKSSDFVITNPDMLHNAILPHHNKKWKSFLSRLRYIVVDEVHTYRGAFGSHVSNVFRRLIRVCDIHGSSPTFICASATIGNPAEHAAALFSREFSLVNTDGASKPEREIYFVNPPIDKSGEYRKGPASVSIPLIRYAAKNGIRTICFCRSRQEVERLHRSVVNKNAELAKIVKPYRGGFLPNERRKLERDLFQKKITVIITTNALELGIDIGDLELCILSGHPGTVASFRQQSGRVGRKGKSIVVYIAKDTAIDQYIVHHPEYITDRPVEQAWLNADNPYILLQHLPCTAYEHPLRKVEPGFASVIYNEACSVLKDERIVAPYKNFLRYALSDYPARGVNLRGMTDYNIEIFCGTEVIGELDPIGARGTLYKDAIYQHLGKRYLSLDLDLEKKLCRVEAVNVDYYTEAVWESRIEMIDRDESKKLFDAKLELGLVNVNRQPKLYKKIKERSFENIGYGPITLPPFEYDTMGFSIFLPVRWKEVIDDIDKRYPGAAFYGLSYILKMTSPGLCMADRKDIDTDVSMNELDDDAWKSVLFLFDKIDGGAGYSEKIYQNIGKSFELCKVIIEECECESGCPACIPSLPPGVSNEDLENLFIESNASIECTKSLLEYFLTGKIVIPDIKIRTIPIINMTPVIDNEKEVIELRNKLSKAAGILKRKRERLH